MQQHGHRPTKRVYYKVLMPQCCQDISIQLLFQAFHPDVQIHTLGGGLRHMLYLVCWTPTGNSLWIE